MCVSVLSVSVQTCEIDVVPWWFIAITISHIFTWKEVIQCNMPHRLRLSISSVSICLGCFPPVSFLIWNGLPLKYLSLVCTVTITSWNSLKLDFYIKMIVFGAAIQEWSNLLCAIGDMHLRESFRHYIIKRSPSRSVCRVMVASDTHSLTSINYLALLTPAHCNQCSMALHHRTVLTDSLRGWD